MFKNYLKIALRNLRRNPGYSFINIFGLAAGLACCILILLFVQHEFSYDRFHEKRDKIYRLVQKRPNSGAAEYWGVTSPAMAGTLIREFPEVTAATSVGETFNPLLSLGDQYYQEQGIFADTAFLDIFTFPLIQGDPKTALADPNSIILTESLARKIFGGADPMGKTLTYQDQQTHIVTGVMADVPETSHLSFSYVLPATSNQNYKDCASREPWNNNGWYTYAELAGGASTGQIEKKLRAFIDKNLADRRPEDRMVFFFQSLSEIHLPSLHILTLPLEKSGNQQYVYLFLAIGFVILLLACINYTNLAVARSIRRAREVGMRKVAGARRGQLAAQFLGESFMMTFLAMALALLLAQLLLPFFSHLVERPLRIDYFDNPSLLPGLLGLTLLVSLLSGAYPAFLLTSPRPVQSLFGKQGSRAGGFTLQHALIVGQYAVSIVLVVGTLVIYRQMQLVQSRDLGYDREHILTVEVKDPALSKHYASIREELLQDSRIVAIGYSKYLPTNVQTKQNMSDFVGSNGKLVSTHTTSIDYDFLDIYGIDMVAGRGFSRRFGTDTLGAPVALVNETTVKTLGWRPEEAVGRDFNFSDGRGRRTIIGVVKDFHFNSIHRSLEPLVLSLDREAAGTISARLRPGDLQETIALFERTIGQFTHYPFEYQFLDDGFDQLYKRDIRLGEMFGLFTLLAILIASLGLFGLAAYTAEQRMKEIGVRKVLGASITNILGLLSKDYIKLVILGFLIATPIAWYAMSRWLENFAYRTAIEWWLFALAGILTVLAALLTVSFQSVKAALMNPVKSLRSE